MSHSLRRFLDTEWVASRIGAAPLELERAWPIDRRDVAVQYRERGQGAWWCVQTYLGRPTPGRIERAIARGDAVALPDPPAVAQRFPLDSRLAALPEILRPRAAESRLASHFEGDADGCLKVRVLSYTPLQRCVVAFDRGPTTLLGKCLRSDSAGRTWEIHRALDEVSGPFDGRQAASPCGRIEEWNLLLWRPHPGTEARELLGTREAPGIVGEIGTLLARLHNSRIAWQRHHDAKQELATASSWVRLAGSMFPSTAPRFHRAFEAVQRTADDSPAGKALPAHRDFHDRQALVHGERLVLIDFDTAALAEAELDIANFLAHLYLHGLRHPEFELAAVADAFLAGYRSDGRIDPGRLRWYYACSLLRLAGVYAFREPSKDISSPLLERAMAACGRPQIQFREVV